VQPLREGTANGGDGILKGTGGEEHVEEWGGKREPKPQDP